MKFRKIALSLCLALPTLMFSASLDEYVDKSNCNQVIDMQLYNICYSYANKGPLSGWVTLKANSFYDAKIFKPHETFYNEDSIPMKYRVKPSDYNGYGEDWNRGHFIVSHADFAYDDKALAKTYTMANIIPQSAPVNQKTWVKVEKYGRVLANQLGYINSISIAKYEHPNNKIANNIVIPSKLYRIYYNNEANFEKCFAYDNVLDVDYKNDRLKDHEIDCKSIKIK